MPPPAKALSKIFGVYSAGVSTGENPDTDVVAGWSSLDDPTRRRLIDYAAAHDERFAATPPPRPCARPAMRQATGRVTTTV